MTDWTIVSRSLRARMFSTVTTVLTVAIAVGLMVVLLVLRSAGRASFERGTGNVHLLVSRDAGGLVSVLNGMFYAGAPLKPLTFAEYERLRASVPLDWSVPIQLGDSYRGAWPVLATTPEFFTRFEPAPGMRWRFAEGGPFQNNFEVVVGATAARATGLRQGQSVILTHGTASSRGGPAVHEHTEYAYTVVGILAPTGTAHDRALFSNLPSAWIIHAADRLERQGGEDHHADHADDHADDHDHHEKVTEADLTPEDRKITGVYLRVATRPGQDASASIPVVMEHLRRHPDFQAAPLTVAGPRAELDKLFAIIGNIDLILLAMAGAVMLSSAVGIMLALYNSMEQRRRQIAVLRVLGASQGRIFSLVVTESAFIGLVGAGLGLVLGLIGTSIAAGVLRTWLGLVIETGLTPTIASGIVLATLLLAIVAGIVPAVMAYRTSVMRNLRPIA
jgi:putative ABC transport system permease protein